LSGILSDQVKKLGIELEVGRAAGWFEEIQARFAEARDRAFEAAAERVLAKAVWTQMKQNAESAATAGGGLRLLATQLEALRADLGKDLEIHLLGHSAGAILLGHLSKRLVARKIDIASLGLYAPACTMAFATDFLRAALKARRLSRQKGYFELLSDRRELGDSVGPYGKSLLYLVSRALEEVHKTPLLGLAAAGTRPIPATSSTSGGWATSKPGTRSGATAPSRACTTSPRSTTARARSRSPTAASTTTSRW
jgi:hypothetical protein